MLPPHSVPAYKCHRVAITFTTDTVYLTIDIISNTDIFDKNKYLFLEIEVLQFTQL